MRLWTLLLILSILSGFIVAQEESSEEVGMSYKDIRLDDAIRTLAKEAKINLILPFELDKKVSIQTEEAVDPLKLLKNVVESHGYELVQDGKVYIVKQVVKEKTDTTTGTQMGTPDTGVPGSIIVKEEGPTAATFQLIRSPVEQAEGKVRALLSPRGTLEVSRESNALYVVDSSANIKAVEDYIKFLNTDPNAAFDARMEQRTYKLNRIPADDINNVMTKMISEKGKFVFDRASMTLSVMDTQDVLDRVDQFIKAADQPEPQLFLRCHFVEVNVTAGTKLATQFTANDISIDSDVTGGSQGAGFNLMPSDLNQLTDTDVALFSVASSKNSISAMLSAQANRDNYRILSSPNLLCYNKQKSSIEIITELPYKQATTETEGSTTTTSTVEFKEVGIKMEVTPEIYSDGTIKLNLKPEVSEEKGARYEGTPVIRKKTVESNVMVKDGQIVVIGGLLEDRISKTRYKVPLLGDIPLLGFLFSREVQSMEKTELVIFLHVTLMNDGNLKNMADQKWREQEEKFQKFDTEFEFYPHLKEKLDMQKLNPNYNQADVRANANAKMAEGFEFVPHK